MGSTAPPLVSKLNFLLAGWNEEPTVKLQELLGQTSQEVTDRVKSLTQQLNQSCSNEVVVSQSNALYYKVLETTLAKQASRGKPLANIIAKDSFHRSLFVCCAEVVVFSHGLHHAFPWIVDEFQMEVFDFFKVGKTFGSRNG